MRPHSHVHIFKQLPDHNDLVLSDQNRAGSSPSAGISNSDKIGKKECCSICFWEIPGGSICHICIWSMIIQSRYDGILNSYLAKEVWSPIGLSWLRRTKPLGRQSLRWTSTGCRRWGTQRPRRCLPGRKTGRGCHHRRSRDRLWTGGCRRGKAVSSAATWHLSASWIPSPGATCNRFSNT